MSSDSGGSGSQSTGIGTAPLDINKSMKRSVQESEHEIENSCSQLQLAMSPSESLSRLLYGSLSPPQSLTKSRMSGMLSAPSSYVRVDEQQHQNEDATQYSRQSSGGSSQDTLQDQDAHTTPNSHESSSSEKDALAIPHQAEEKDGVKSEMVFITDDYYSKSLSSIYCVIHKSNIDTNMNSRQSVQPDDLATSQPVLGDNTTSDQSLDAAPLFSMDDDDDKEQAQDLVKEGDSPNAFISTLSLNFPDKESAIPNVCSATGSPDSSLSDQPRSKDEVHTPVLVPTTAAVPNSTGYIDKADVHRDTTNNLRVANTGGITTGIKRQDLCMSISNCSQQSDHRIPKFTIGDAKVESMLHSQGLDQDYTNLMVTLTSTLYLPKYARNADSLYALENVTFKLSAYVYEGPVEKDQVIGQASAVHKLSDEERQSLLVRMTVHQVASQKDIIFVKRNPVPDKLFVRVTAEILH